MIYPGSLQNSMTETRPTHHTNNSAEPINAAEKNQTLGIHEPRQATNQEMRRSLYAKII